jgi:hypothetical protein
MAAPQHRGEIGDQKVRSLASTRGEEWNYALPEDEKDAPPRGG